MIKSLWWLPAAIAILGAKGGVGTTTVAANLAAALAHDNTRSVLLLDLNLFLGDVGLHVGIEAQPTVMQWMLGSDEDNKKDSIATHPLGFSVLGLASDLSDAEAVPAEDVLRLLDRMRDLFDVVVIDEASQMRSEEAIGGIARGKQIVIVGDSEQLPPTSFFQRHQDLDDDD